MGTRFVSRDYNPERIVWTLKIWETRPAARKTIVGGVLFECKGDLPLAVDLKPESYQLLFGRRIEPGEMHEITAIVKKDRRSIKR